MFRSKYNMLIFVTGLLAIFVLSSVATYNKSNKNFTEISYSSFLGKVSASSISKVTIMGNNIAAETKSHEYVKTVFPAYDPSLITKLQQHHVDIWVKKIDAQQDGGAFSFTTWIFIIFLGSLIWFFIRRSKSDPDGKGGAGPSASSGNPFSFGKSRARVVSPKDSNISFEDVAGVEEAKEDLGEIVEFLKDPEKFKNLGAKIPTGCLLVGAPGNGKTLLARAIAGEAKVPFFIISGSDFVEMFVGVGAARVRSLFEKAKRVAPCIVFIDEIDAVGRHRGAGLGGGNDEREQTLNQLLVEMDGFSPNLGIIVVAATNRPDVLDPALLRPGRFDRQITIPYPDIIGREQILNVHMKKVPLAADVSVTTLAKGTTGFSGADLANLVNEAALFAAKQNRKQICMNDFERARDRVIMGSERKSMKMTQEDKELTAYHEAGHTVVALTVKNYHPLHKVSIVPRGRALGVTAVLPDKDQLNYSYKQLVDQLAVMYGGRVAEYLIYGEDSVTTGASNDIQVASNLARRMVSEWGFSSELGPIRYEPNESEVFLGHSVTQKKNISEETQKKIDQEVYKLLVQAQKRTTQILKDKMEDLKLITQALLVHETLSGAEVENLLKNRDPQNLKATDDEKDAADNLPSETAGPNTSLPVFENN